MAEPAHSTRLRLRLVARDLLVTHGIQRVSMAQVAASAGLTRVTIYRHFAGREDLVREAFLHLADSLDTVIADASADPHRDVEAYLARIGAVVVALPAGLQQAMGELQRAYPAVFAEVRRREQSAISALFDLLYSAAEEQGRIRPGLRRSVVEALFWSMVTSFIDDPDLRAEGLAPAAVFDTLVSILLNGLLVPPPAAGPDRPPDPAGEA